MVHGAYQVGTGQVIKHIFRITVFDYLLNPIQVGPAQEEKIFIFNIIHVVKIFGIS